MTTLTLKHSQQVLPLRPDPVSNTGSEFQPRGTILLHTALVAGIDYLTLMGDVGSLSEVDALVEKLFRTVFDYTTPGRRYYGVQRYDSVSSPLGVGLSYRSVLDKGYRIRLTIPGKPLMALNGSLLWELIQTAHSLNWYATRLDVAIDDYEKRFCPNAIQSALDSGNVLGFLSYKQINSSATGASLMAGWSYALGSRQSDKYYRIYNKCAESKGAIDCHRFEGEFKGDFAIHLWGEVTKCPDAETALNYLAAVAVGNISFIDRTVDNNQSRCPKLGWWSDFTARVGSEIKLRIERVQPTISRKIDWIKTKVMSTLAVISQCKGTDWLELFLNIELASAIERLGASAKAFIRTEKLRDNAPENRTSQMLNKVVTPLRKREIYGEKLITVGVQVPLVFV